MDLNPATGENRALFERFHLDLPLLLGILALMGFALVVVLMAAGSLNLSDIVLAQQGELGFINWFMLPLLPMFVVYFISGVAETNRAPFDVAEGESEIVAGFHVEYSGMTFGVFFLAEYSAMILFSMLTAVLFLGGWSPGAEMDSFLL